MDGENIVDAPADGAISSGVDSAGADATPPQQQQADAEPQQAADAVPTDGLGEGEGAQDDQHQNDVVGAPEGDYDFTGVQLPEGFSLSESAVGEFSKVAKDLNLSQSAASKLVEKVGPAIEQAQRQRVEAIGQDWLREAYADPDMGGANWKATMADANRALHQFASPQVKQILAATGLNKNPDVIRMFREIGRATGQDRIITGKPAAPKTDPLADLYNHSNMN